MTRSIIALLHPTSLRRVPRVELAAAAVAVGVGILVLLTKFAAFAITGSSAIFTDAAESIVNVLASGFAMLALLYSRRPADAEHPYGHGKIEFLSALVEGGMICIAALVALARAAEAVWRGPELHRLDWGIALVAIAGVVNGLVGSGLIAVGKRQGALPLEANGRHLLTDFVTSVILLAALFAVRFTGMVWLDPLAACLLALYLGWEGIHLARRAAANLLDRQDADDDQRLTGLLDAHVGPDGLEPRICSYHKLRHRHVGRDHWIDFHLVVPAGWSVECGHEVGTRIEMELQSAFGRDDPDHPGDAFATAHIEPCHDEGCAHCAPGTPSGKVPACRSPRPESG